MKELVIKSLKESKGFVLGGVVGASVILAIAVYKDKKDRNRELDILEFNSEEELTLRN